MRVFFSATSYPRSVEDWQGLFIRNLVVALAQEETVKVSLWAPDGPRPSAVEYACSEQDTVWLQRLMARGGIAHLLKYDRLRGLASGAQLLWMLRRAYRRALATTDVYHVNWLQNSLPLPGVGKPAVISVLGTDLRLLSLPGMKTALRRVLRRGPTILAPNAQWMYPTLEDSFGDLCEVRPTPFGIDQMWFDCERQFSPDTASIWLVVMRITKAKMGPLFEWGRPIFDDDRRQLHLFGPNQENLKVPDWIHYHGAATPSALAREWFPRAAGLISLSAHDEGRPQVMLEAMAAGLPLIASQLPAHRDFIRNNYHGVLVDSIAAFSNAVDRLAEPETNRTMSAHCKEFAHAEYGTWRDCAARYLDIYKALTR